MVRSDDALGHALILCLVRTTLWQAVASTQFDSRRWGEDLVLYVLATGETHAITAAHGAVFLTLQEAGGPPQSADHWLAALSDDVAGPTVSLDDDASALQVLTTVLNDLHRIGVVERRPA